MSSQSEASAGIVASHSHFLLGVCAYNALGVACVTLVVVTKPVSKKIVLFSAKSSQYSLKLPVDLPASCAHFIKLSNCAAFLSEAAQSSTFTVLSTPDVLWLAFIPVKRAVAVLHESGTSLLAE